MKVYFIAQGRSNGFPVRMLGRDQAWPASPADADVIVGTYGDRSGRARRWNCQLVSDLDGAPSISEWAKYGVKIMDVGLIPIGKQETQDETTDPIPD